MSYNPNAGQWPPTNNSGPEQNNNGQTQYQPPNGYGAPNNGYQQQGQFNQPPYNNGYQQQQGQPPYNNGYQQQGQFNQPPYNGGYQQQGQPPFGYQQPSNNGYQQQGQFNQQPPFGYQQSYGLTQNRDYTSFGAVKASFGTRFVAYLVDAIIVQVVVGIIFTPLNLAFWSHNGNFGLSGGLFYLILGIYGFATTMWLGNTIGKKLMHIKVVSTDGSAPSQNNLIMRYIVGYLVSGVVICLGFLWAAWDPQKQGWDDKFGNTYVVRE